MLITSTPTNAAALMSLVASVCVYICPVRALTFESATRVHFEFTGTSSEPVGQVHMSRSQEQNGIYKCNQIHTFTGGLSLIKRRSRFWYTRIKSRYTMNLRDDEIYHNITLHTDAYLQPEWHSKLMWCRWKHCTLHSAHANDRRNWLWYIKMQSAF